MNTQKLQASLVHTGLNHKQIKVYLTLLEYPNSTAGKVAQQTKLKRSSVYLIIKQLAEKGLVSQFQKRGLSVFRAIHPSFIIESEKEKLLELEQAIPELNGLRGVIENSPNITLYEGYEEVVDLCEDTLQCSTELLSWVDMASITKDKRIREYSKEYWRKRVERNIRSRGVWAYDKKALEYKKAAPQENRELLLIPKKHYPFKNEIWVYDQKVAILSVEDMIGVIIENAPIADTHRALFELSFSIAKTLEHTVLTKKDLNYLQS